MMNWFKEWWPWNRIQVLEETIKDLRDTIDDKQNWCDTAVMERDRLKIETETIREENLKLMAEASTFKATLREFKKLCEMYDGS